MATLRCAETRRYQYSLQRPRPKFFGNKFYITFKLTIIMQPEVLRKELLICLEMHLTKAIFTPYRVTLAQARKSYRIRLLFTHKNGDFRAIT